MSEEILTQAHLLTHRIRQEIVESTLPPGTKLKVRELSQRYQVGSSPIREALSRLVTTSLVVSEDRRGFRVAPVTIHELERLFWTRIGVETLALREAIRRGNKQWEAQVVASHHLLGTLARPTDMTSPAYRDWDNAHQAFHRKLLQACDSTWLLDLIDSLYQHCSRYRWLAMRNSKQGLERRASDEHRSLLDACLRRDEDDAVQLLTLHYQKTLALSRHVLEDQQTMTAIPIRDK
jgi:GntR family carbon starvation induced transcriptional regulator